MLQIPQLPPTTPTTLREGPAPEISETSETSEALEGGGDFARMLGAQAPEDQPAQADVPQELIADALQQLEDGVPLDEVLKGLREKLEELSESLPAAATPIAAAAQDAGAALADLSDDVLLARLGLRQPAVPGRDVSAAAGALPTPGRESAVPVRPPLAAAIPEGVDPEPDVNLPEDLKSHRLELVPGKEVPGLQGRQRPAESTAVAAQPVPGQGQAVPMKTLELPLSLNGVLPSPGAQINSPAEALSVPNRAGGLDGAQSLSIPTRVGEQGWSQALAQRVMWMVGRDQQSAELKLNPAHLGPIEVKLTMKQDQASVTLLANNAAVKEALEMALPRLRDMFSQQDIQLVQADVGQRQDPRQGEANAQMSGRQGQGGPVDAGHGHGQDAADLDAGESRVVQQGLGLVDAYA